MHPEHRVYSTGCWSGLSKALLISVVSLLFTVFASSQDVLTQHNDNARTGQNLYETILTPGNVNSSSFGRLFTLAVDGKVDAQPLYISSLAIPGNGTRNVLIVATEHDSVYAFDADSGSTLWRVSLLGSGENTSDTHACGNLTPEIGITATPVINRTPGSNAAIYVVAMSKDSSGNYHQRLHALDPAAGTEIFAGPAEITATYPGTGDNSSGGNVIFDPGQYMDRSALLLLNGVVYTTWASHCDIRPYTGWIMGYSASNLAQVSVLNVTPNGNDGAIWMAGAGPATDDSGNIYILDGNGVFDNTLNASGFPSNGDYGNAFLKLSTTSGLAVADYFEMDSQVSENAGDVDIGSGGALVLPDQSDATGDIWHLAVGAGKDHNLYVVNRDSMGKFNASSNNIYQQLTSVFSNGIFSAPVYFNGTIYYGAVKDPIYAFQLSNARLSTAATAQTSNTYAYPGATIALSANQTSNAILWATENVSPAVLHAYDAVTLQELYNSNQAANSRDHYGSGNKYITPTIANGKVYVGTTNSVGVFGLLTSPAATPTFSPAPGVYSTTQSVMLSDGSAGATIYYTTDGSNPSSSSNVYGGAITVAATTTIRAIATAPGLSVSPVANGTYTIQGQAATPTFSPAPGTYNSTQSVRLSDTVAGATIYYTTDGSTPSTSSNVYSGAISVPATTTIQAIATAPGFATSAVASGTYTIQGQAAAPTFNPAPGTYSNSVNVNLADTTAGAVIHCTTDGTTPTAASPACTTLNLTATTTIRAVATASGLTPSALASGTYTVTTGAMPINLGSGFSAAGIQMNGNTKLNGTRLQLTDTSVGHQTASAYWTTPVNVQSFTNDFTFQLTNPNADGFAFFLQNAGLTAMGAGGGGLGSSGVRPSVAVKFDLYDNMGEGNNSTGLFSNGAAPALPATTLGGGVNLHSGDILQVHMVYNGTTLTMTITDTANPSLTYMIGWPINIPGTVGGNAAYAGFSAATGGGTATQEILAWTYSTGTATSPAATPAFTPVAGTYSGPQSVTISDTTAGASIFYTLDGSAPATSAGGSTLQYTAPISVTASETINAMAMATGFSPSATASAGYTITPPPAATPVIMPTTGSYTSAQTVTITDSTPGATINYTLDGSTPTSSSSTYTGAFSVNATTTVNAIATAANFSPSALASASYTITLPAATPVIMPAAGSYTSAQTVTITDSTTGAAIHYTLDGSTPTTTSPTYAGVFSVNATATVKAIATAANFSPSALASASYTITLPAATPIIMPAAGSYTTAQTVAITDSTTRAAIHYTLDGSTPTTTSPTYVGAFSVNTTTTVMAMATAANFSPSATASASYTITLPAATPVIMPTTGSYTSAQTVTITDSTAGATIYYTLDGSTPTSSSPMFTGAFPVNATTTVKAIATAANFSPSAMTTSVIAIQSGTAAVNFGSGFSTAGIQMNGNTKLNGTRLQLTDTSVGHQTASAYWTTPVNVQSFTNDFTFQLTNPNADGFTFILQNAGLTAMGTGGGGLGSSGVKASVAVKFDLYDNLGEGNNSTGLFSKGAAPALPATTLAGGVNLHSGDILQVHMVYNGTTLTMTITDTATPSQTFTISWPINIPAMVGGNTAYVGFTAATGGGTATQEILAWTYAH